MKLLILTQKVDRDDDVLGFFHEWLRGFSSRVEKLTVICLQKGEYSLPSNASVLSLGKESGVSRLKYLFNFYKYIWQERNNYDAVFVHMNPIYFVFGGLFWKLQGKKTALWYTHKNVDWKLKTAEKLTDIIFTASKESFRLKSDKVRVLSHGIDVDRFKPSNPSQNNTGIISVGRIAPVKNYEFLINAAKILNDRGTEFDIKIVGAPILDIDKTYLESLKKIIKKNGLGNSIHFFGSVPHEQIMSVYSGSKIFVNLSDTGSLDKAVLEAMASGLLVLTSNEAFRDILAPKYFTSKDPAVVAEKLTALMCQNVDPELRRYVAENHSLKKLIDKILIAI